MSCPPWSIPGNGVALVCERLKRSETVWERFAARSKTLRNGLRGLKALRNILGKVPKCPGMVLKGLETLNQKRSDQNSSSTAWERLDNAQKRSKTPRNGLGRVRNSSIQNVQKQRVKAEKRSPRRFETAQCKTVWKALS